MNFPVTRRSFLPLLAAAADTPLARAQSEVQQLRFSLSDSMIGDVNVTDARSAIIVWLKRIEQDLKVTLRYDPNIFESPARMLGRLHEFRTPLNAILGYADMITEDARQSSGAASILPMLDKVQLAGRHLLELINDILDMSRIESGRMNLQPARICVETIARDAVALVAPLAAKRGNRLDLHQDPAAAWIEADETRYRQCLLNLLGNACKFTSAGVVSLDVRKFSSPDKDWIDWTVRDTGIGIASHQIPRLFQPFNQVDSAITRKYGGTGLGLAISQRLCSMMGGAISVESRLGEGSAFTIRIPASPSSKEPSHVRT